MFEKFGLKVELIPLSPGHAWNRTDARIAHMNTFLRSIKRASRIFGAEQVAQAFHLASDPSVARVRKFMARSHVMFRIIKLEWTPTQIEDFAKQKGAVVLDRRLHQGRMGVNSGSPTPMEVSSILAGMPVCVSTETRMNLEIQRTSTPGEKT